MVKLIFIEFKTFICIHLFHHSLQSTGEEFTNKRKNVGFGEVQNFHYQQKNSFHLSGNKANESNKTRDILV